MIQTNISLLPFHTFGAKVNADFFTSVQTVEDLIDTINDNSKNFLILGGGSNVLFTKNYEGLIIKNEIPGFEIIQENDQFIDIKIGAGENWHDMVMKTVSHGWQGIENLALIPGTVGAAPIQNIGAYGVEAKDVIIAVDYLNYEDLKVKTFTNQECNFGYRNSIFKNELKGKACVVNVTIRLNKQWDFNTSYGAINQQLEEKNITEVTPEILANTVIDIRNSKLPNPKEIGNCGSFFKNPVLPKDVVNPILEKYENAPHYKVGDDFIKLPAGWLIEKSGWKGKTKGNVGTYDKQALVLINKGGATGEEAWDLAMTIKRDVFTKFGIDIEPEVNII
ncbi:UDP-N-acetylmuramate dehydrogenase [Flammeovirga pacifica]|uniref:UDP-N-acetylenolpyruvoylglucosamine reductase n=1 Tax=Flammeovirga pacifica TaxID=915059 RepID=A0A1S1YWW9_FLAPC|nr:UDP-N-acetylmuramate dehydrogenase [Flammeovirga pacifica]OHX65498.1 UDP-N-acetylenolpyruvoylglucosamine reductase [Flammeovirga pacifica]